MNRRRKSTITPPSPKLLQKNIFTKNTINEEKERKYRKTIYKSKSLPADLGQQDKRSQQIGTPQMKFFQKGTSMLKSFSRAKSVTFQPEILLITAVSEDDIEEVSRILKRNNVDINYKTASGQSVIYHAALTGSYDCLKLLIKHGADVNSMDSSGRSVLDVAVRNGFFDCAAELIQNGARVEKLATGGVFW